MLVIKIVTIDNKPKLGENFPIQICKSIIVRRNLIKTPSLTYGVIKEGTWVVGAIEETSRNMVLEIVPNRKKEIF